MTLTDRTCVVTGSSRGIGRGIAIDLANHGANVVVNYRSSEAEAYDVVDVIDRNGGHVIAVQADVTDPDQVQRLRDRVHEEFGAVHVLVNNAGINIDTKFSDMTRDKWDRVMEVNLGGMFTCTKSFFDDLCTVNQGRLINISSVIGKQGNYGQANYATAKSGMFGFTRSLALELAPFGATSNCVAPGYTATEMVKQVREDIQEKIKSKIPLKRFATVEEIGAAVRFLSDTESSYITGEVIDINGGIDL